MGEMRLYYYAGVSTALAAGVVISAFNQRANFYSACVYLAQSNLCLMILINLILFVYGSLVYGLQRLCYGPLRPIEIEQLYEKAWFAITETCLAMTIFREEVGAWFLVMFVALLSGKVWGWIGGGRVEVLEQQPPANPRLFHFRLSVSLGLSVLYDIWLMTYTINTVIQQARPNMMVMFLFEFAILTTSSVSTAFRYCISLIEARVVKKQTYDRLNERRLEIREERAEATRQRSAAAEGDGGSSMTESIAELPSEDDVDEMDIEVPGWEAKGHWVLTLDLITDFVKLGIYSTFFFILLTFYGLPIHIMRDLFMTTRSFVKRLTAFLRYRRATQDMNTRYEDATVEDIGREDTCIICREEMRPWAVTNPQIPAPVPPGALPRARPTATVSERSRPKKLPCGHILHLGCLKSWLERQQVCPTCRRPVVENAQAARATAGNANRGARGLQPQVDQQDRPGAPPPPAGQGNRGMRMLNIGPLRVGFGQANLQDIAQGFGGAQPGPQNAAAAGPRVYGLELGFPRRLQPQPQAQGTENSPPTNTIQDQLLMVEQRITQEIRSLQRSQQELQLVQLLQNELARLRLLQSNTPDTVGAANILMPQMPQIGPVGTRHGSPFSVQMSQMQRHGARPNTSAIPAGSPDLPAGVTIPEGWSLLPLQRLTGDAFGVTQTGAPTVPGAVGTVATATTPFTSNLMDAGLTDGGSIRNSNNTNISIVAANTQNQPQASSLDSSDTNVVHAPLSSSTHQATPTRVPNTTVQNTTTSTTVPSIPTSQPLALPDWGSSQLFLGPTMSANTNNLSESTPLPPSSAEASSQANIGSSTSVSTSEPSHDADERRREKGKANAATVEDTIDDPES